MLETELQRVVPISGVCLNWAIKGMLVPVCACSFPVGFISVIYSPALQIHLFFKVGKSYLKSRTN